jgi:hypothetical protein
MKDDRDEGAEEASSAGLERRSCRDDAASNLSGGSAALRASWALIVVGALVGCRRDPNDREARSLVRAYEAFQGASAVDRPAALDALAKAGCAAFCAERDACASYAGHLLHAQQLVQKARELGPEDAGGNGAASAAERAIILSGADDATQRASAAEPSCKSALDRLSSARRAR